MSSPPPPPPPPPPPSGYPPPPPPTGSPPPPPPSGSPPPPPPPPPPSATSANSTSSITSANYFFGFVITFVVLLLLFVGCGVGSWRRFRIIGTAWDERLQAMDGSPVVGRKRGRRRLVRPAWWEPWTSPKGSAHLASGKWQGVQPISAAFVWSRGKLAMGARRSGAPTTVQAPGRENDGSVHGVGTTLWTYVLPRRPRCTHQPKPPPVERPPPEAIQVAVMIAMPCPPSAPLTGKPSCVGHASAGEYQIGVVRIPWPSGDGP